MTEFQVHFHMQDILKEMVKKLNKGTTILFCPLKKQTYLKVILKAVLTKGLWFFYMPGEGAVLSSDWPPLISSIR